MINRDLIVFHPLGIRLSRGEFLLDLLIGNNAAFDHIDQEHLPWLKPAFALDLLRSNVEHARFRSHHDKVVVRHHITSRPQAVAVERRPNDAAVCKRDGRGPVPRLH